MTRKDILVSRQGFVHIYKDQPLYYYDVLNKLQLARSSIDIQSHPVVSDGLLLRL